MYLYISSTGELFQETLGHLTSLAIGYSGHGDGRNEPKLEAEHNIGPIPCGFYLIGPTYDHTTLGPTVMNLEPWLHNALGRSAFRIHGDNAKHDASEGCIIMPPFVREPMAKGKDKLLLVLAYRGGQR